jgi:hypothetical protein
MDAPHIYEIVIEDHLSDQWSDWFGGLTIQHDPNGQTRLTGLLSDQAALYGVLSQIHSLNLVLVSVLRIPDRSTLNKSPQDGDLTQINTTGPQ